MRDAGHKVPLDLSGGELSVAASGRHREGEGSMGRQGEGEGAMRAGAGELGEMGDGGGVYGGRGNDVAAVVVAGWFPFF